MKVLEPNDAVVLIVEDNPDNMLVLHDALINLCGVKYCDGRASGANLFGMLAANPRLRPNLILLDIEIPHEDGYIVLQQIRNRPLLQQTRVVAVTAHVTSEHVERARKAGFDGFIGKPLDLDRFPDQIRRILEGEHVWEPL